MNRNIIDLVSWEINPDGVPDEIGLVSQVLILNFRTIIEDEIVQKQYPILAQSEHFISADNFVLKRDSWATSGGNDNSYLNSYEVLEMLEKVM